jgi:hypothetical protein
MTRQLPECTRHSQSKRGGLLPDLSAGGLDLVGKFLELFAAISQLFFSGLGGLRRKFAREAMNTTDVPAIFLQVSEASLALQSDVEQFLRGPTEHRIRLSQVTMWAQHTVKEGPAGITKRQRVRELLRDRA